MFVLCPWSKVKLSLFLSPPLRVEAYALREPTPCDPTWLTRSTAEPVHPASRLQLSRPHAPLNRSLQSRKSDSQLRT